jgi:hypothetical protein
MLDPFVKVDGDNDPSENEGFVQGKTFRSGNHYALRELLSQVQRKCPLQLSITHKSLTTSEY